MCMGQSFLLLFHCSVAGQKCNLAPKVGSTKFTHSSKVNLFLKCLPSHLSSSLLPLILWDHRSNHEPRVGKPRQGYAHQGAACCWSSAAAAKLLSFRRPRSYCGHSQEGSQSLLTGRAAYRGSLIKKREEGRDRNIREKRGQACERDTALHNSSSLLCMSNVCRAHCLSPASVCVPMFVSVCQPVSWEECAASTYESV